jgi:hypothetical protein
MRPWKCPLLACCLLLALALPALAGMASPLPTEPVEYRKVLRLDGTARERLDAISFFVLGLVLAAAAVRWLWNALQRDFPVLPRLSFARALAGVLLWGLFAVVVLTMIAGARELMTPGAWRKQGFTYQLADAAVQEPAPTVDSLRRQHLERLRTALWQFAATHQGRFPSPSKMSAIPAELWEVPGSGGMRYLYVPGLSAGHLPELLVYEPELDPQRRFVLKANGDVLSVTSAEVRDALKPEGQP